MVNDIHDHFGIWNMMSRKLIALKASNLLHSAESCNGNKLYGDSRHDSLKSKRYKRGWTFMSPNGPWWRRRRRKSVKLIEKRIKNKDKLTLRIKNWTEIGDAGLHLRTNWYVNLRSQTCDGSFSLLLTRALTTHWLLKAWKRDVS